MSFGVVFLCIIAVYILYYAANIIYDLFFDHEKDIVEELKQAEEEIDVSDENENFKPTQIFVEKKTRDLSEEEDEEEEENKLNDEEESEEHPDGVQQGRQIVQMNDGYNVDQIQTFVNEHAADPETESSLDKISMMYK
jgi:hypothetical protein